MSNRNTSTLKRRRPFGHEESSPTGRLFQGHTHHAPPGIDDASSLTSDDQQYILEQAAQILSLTLAQLVELTRSAGVHNIVEQAALTLDVPVASLIELSRQQHDQRNQKRPRLSTSPTMPTWGSVSGSPVAHEAVEKLTEPRFPTPHGSHSDGRRELPAVSGPGSLLGLNGSRMVEYLTSFPVCNPCTGYESQPEEYQPLHTSAPFSYGIASSSAPPVTTDTVPASALVVSTTQAAKYDVVPIATTSASVPAPRLQSTLVGCYEPAILDDSSMAPTQYNPPMRQQSADVVGMQQQQQPTTAGETMFYPAAPTPTVACPQRPMSGPGPTDMTEVPPLAPHAHLPEQVQFEPAGALVGSYAMSVGTPSPQSAHPAGMGEPIPSYGNGMLPLVYGPALADRAMSMGLDPYGRAHNLDMAFPSHRAPPAKRGPFKDHAERQKTAYTRKIGSCIRCRMQRIRCHTDPDNDKGPCGTCKKVANANKIWRLPCLRLKINDILLSKPGQVKGFEWTQRWKDSVVPADISTWASSETRTIQVTEGFTGKSVELTVRQFVPQAGDSLERSWMANGVKKSVRIPPYAIVDMDAAKVSYDSYIKTGILECCKYLLGARERLLWRTYVQALQMSNDASLDRKERQLLCWTLELWMSIRLTTTSFEIVGEDTLDMPRDIMDETSPLHGKIPLPPVLGAQLDSILIHQIQSKFRHDTLDLLQKMTQENKQKTWLATYLATFILLHNIALVIKHDAGYARKHGMKRRFAREEKVKQYYMGAITLLAYFHYRGGGKIFATDFKDDDLRLHLGEEAVQFIAYTRRFAKERDKQWREVAQGTDIEDEFFFVSQMYEQNWMPRSWPCD